MWRTMSPAGATSAGNGPQHPHSGNDDGWMDRRPQAWPCGPPPLSGGCGLDRAGPVTPRSTIGMKDAEVLLSQINELREKDAVVGQKHKRTYHQNRKT